MTAPRVMILALHDRSLGRVGMAVRMAGDLVRAGMEVVFAVHANTTAYVRARNLPVVEITESLGPLAELALREALTQWQPNHVILCDYFGTCNMLHRCGLGAPEFLLDWPLTSLDIWDSDLTGAIVDRATGERVPLCLGTCNRCWELFRSLTRRLVPCPIGSPEGSTPRVRVMPSALKLRRRRSNTKRRILTTTARWQTAGGPQSHRRGFPRNVPHLLTKVLSSLPRNFEWLHIGPEPFRLPGGMPAFYRWQAPVSEEKMQDILRRSDVFLSLNASSSIMFEAVCAGMPTVMVQNSRTDTAIGPFALWPLGYRRFLAPLIDDNPLYEPIEKVEIAFPDRLIETFARILYMPEKTAEAEDRASDLRSRIGALPTLADRLNNPTSAAPRPVRFQLTRGTAPC